MRSLLVIIVLWTMVKASVLPSGIDLVADGGMKSFAGVNSFFLHTLEREDRLAVLDAVQAAGLKLIRIFISYTVTDNKGTGSREMPDIEPEYVGTWNDTQLEAIDYLMVEARERNIKLVVAIHDRYQLGCWGNDSYVKKYDLPAVDCNTGKASDNDVAWWYSDWRPIEDFQNRISHVLQHSNKLLEDRPLWKDLSEYIFAFNIQNEGQGHLNGNTAPVPEWWCDRAIFMRDLMGPSKVLISTGGGNEFLNSDITENWDCSALDLVDIHSYSGVDEFRTQGPLALQHALAAQKLMLFEEFGATGSDKAGEIEQHIEIFNELGVPWMPWEISKPGKGGDDFEFWTDEETYEIVATGANIASRTDSLLDFRW